MKDPTSFKTWEKTKVQNLLRHKSGRYYARLFQNGKEVWKALKTAHLSVARARLADILKEHRKNKGREVDPSNAKLTFAQAAALHKKRTAERSPCGPTGICGASTALPKRRRFPSIPSPPNARAFRFVCA